jgi:putative intracellular protease/amidase
MTPDEQHVLFVVTSRAEIGPRRRPTGCEFSEVAHPYLAFVDAGFAVDFASPSGGRPPEDGYDATDAASAIFRHGPGFADLNASARPAEVAGHRYAAIFFPGGLGPMVDVHADPVVQRLVAGAAEAGKVVGAVCHGPVALLGVDLSEGRSFLTGRRVTGFTTAEEEGHSKDDVPFMLDEALGAAGALHGAAAPFQPHVVTDGRLVTGQTPASAAGVALAMIALLGGPGIGQGAQNTLARRESCSASPKL